MSSPETDGICIVLTPVPADDRLLRGRAKRIRLSILARQSLACAARIRGIRLGALDQNEAGAPLPSGGIYWSISHKSTYVAAALAAAPIGVDLERIRPFSEGLIKKIAVADEWALDNSARQLRFFRYWTAKEAVLKAVGVGLKDLSRCRIAAVSDSRHMQVVYRSRSWNVEHFYFKDHIAGTTDIGGSVQWHLHTGAQTDEEN